MSGNWLPAQASFSAPDVDRLFFVTFALTGGFFVLVVGVLLVAVVRFRYRGGEDQRPARYDHGTWRHELVWASVPGVLLIGLAVLSETTWARLRAVPRTAPDGPVVDILAQQYAWHVRYPGPDNRFGRTETSLASEANPFGLDRQDPAAADDIVVMNEIYLPKDRQARLILRSRDVIHGFYLPEFRTQQNVVPGAALDLWLRPTRPGRYEVLCNQFCGLAHYRMRAVLTVGDEEGLRQWLAERR